MNNNNNLDTLENGSSSKHGMSGFVNLSGGRAPGLPPSTTSASATAATAVAMIASDDSPSTSTGATDAHFMGRCEEKKFGAAAAATKSKFPDSVAHRAPPEERQNIAHIPQHLDHPIEHHTFSDFEDNDDIVCNGINIAAAVLLECVV